MQFVIIGEPYNSHQPHLPREFYRMSKGQGGACSCVPEVKQWLGKLQLCPSTCLELLAYVRSWPSVELCGFMLF